MEKYNIELIEPLASKYVCPLCNGLLRDPIQTFRGELACEDCYKSTLGNGGICPIDGEPITLNHTFKDKSKNLEIKNLKCFCENKIYGCLWEGTVGKVETHQNECIFKAKECDHCNIKIVQGKYYNHLQQSCTNILKQNECVFKDVGCDYQVESRNYLLDHLKEGALVHSALYMTNLQNREVKYEVIHNEVANCKQAMMKMEKKHDDERIELFRKISLLSNTVEHLQKTIAESKINIDKNSELSTSQISKKIKEHSKEIERIHTTFSMTNRNLSDLDLKQQLMENTCYDGKILWKIDKYSQRLDQALTGQVTAVHSAPGFTDKYGYKFCGRLYLNGDGMGRNTHMSLFFVLMKSEYDNLSQWPFKRRVVFRLINQNDETRSVKESFLPDPDSSSFQKPTKDMNVAAGCPMFFSKELLGKTGFVKDDGMFIEISVL